MNFKEHPMVKTKWVDYKDETCLEIRFIDDTSVYTMTLNEDGKLVGESNTPHGSRVAKMNLADLKEVLDSNFGHPFLERDMVQTKIGSYKGEATLEIQIGRRDVTILQDGTVLHAGTSLCESC